MIPRICWFCSTPLTLKQCSLSLDRPLWSISHRQLQVSQGLHFWNGFGEYSFAISAASKNNVKAFLVLTEFLEAAQFLEAVQEHSFAASVALKNCVRMEHELVNTVCYPKWCDMSPLTQWLPSSKGMILIPKQGHGEIGRCGFDFPFLLVPSLYSNLLGIDEPVLLWKLLIGANIILRCLKFCKKATNLQIIVF